VTNVPELVISGVAFGSLFLIYQS